MKCQFCNQENSENAIVCKKCGKVLDYSAQQPASTPRQDESLQKGSESGQTKNSVLLPLFLAVFWSFALVLLYKLLTLVKLIPDSDVATGAIFLGGLLVSLVLSFLNRSKIKRSTLALPGIIIVVIFVVVVIVNVVFGGIMFARTNGLPYEARNFASAACGGCQVVEAQKGKVLENDSFTQGATEVWCVKLKTDNVNHPYYPNPYMLLFYPSSMSSSKWGEWFLPADGMRAYGCNFN